MSVSPTLLDRTLAAQPALVSYVRQRLGPGAAEDVVQDALFRLAEHAPELDGQADLTRWLWRVVRNATVDAHRRAQVASRRDRARAAEQPEAAMPPGDEPRSCACYRPLLDGLDPAHAEVLRADLDGEDPAALAERLGVTASALRVRRHRARRQLDERLAEACRACAGCLDGSCAPPRSTRHPEHHRRPDPALRHRGHDLPRRRDGRPRADARRDHRGHGPVFDAASPRRVGPEAASTYVA